MLTKSLEEKDHITHLKETFAILRKYNMKLNPAKCTFGVTSGKFLGYIVTKRGIEANPDQIRAVQNIQQPRCVKDVQKLTGRLAALSRFISRYSEKSKPFFSTLQKGKNFVWTEECAAALEDQKTYLMSPPLLSKPVRHEPLFIYLVVSSRSLNAVLVREDNGRQHPIFYTSRSMVDAETRYT